MRGWVVSSRGKSVVRRLRWIPFCSDDTLTPLAVVVAVFSQAYPHCSKKTMPRDETRNGHDTKPIPDGREARR